MVLGQGGGALQNALTPFKLFLGGAIGDGQQLMSWIHIEDLVSLILFSLNNEKIYGPLIMKRPCWLPLLAVLLKILLGEVSGVLIKGQNVIPEKAFLHGFQFKYPSLKNALKNLL
ncbi:MAG: DUF1731 domain-containing protein [Bdellovibrio sp.]|nr:DUF1731 domain-containing protein [Bdellovibrio sp.]